MPSQLPPHTFVEFAQSGRWPRGVPLIGTHVPSLPLSPHASHCPVHAESQQTKSTQWPLAQVASLWHATPFGSPAASARDSPHERRSVTTIEVATLVRTDGI